MKEGTKSKSKNIFSFEYPKFHEEMMKFKNTEILKVHGSIVKEKLKTENGTSPILNETKKIDDHRTEKIQERKEKRAYLCNYKILQTI